MHWCGWSLQYLWRWTNWLERLDVSVLALMLAHLALSVIRFNYRYRKARPTKAQPDNAEFRRGQKALLADLNLRVSSVKSIAFVAPFLGLTGACLGILSIFRGYDGSRYGYVVMAATGTAAALISTAAGLLVSIAAIISHNYLCTKIDFLDREIPNPTKYCNRYFQFAQNLPLIPRFSSLSFAVIATPTLALAMTIFMAFSSFTSPMGLDVQLLKVGALDPANDFLAAPIIVGIFEKSSDGQMAVYVDGKNTPLKELGNTVRNRVKSHPQAVAYVEAEKAVGWADVTSVIDAIRAVHAKVVLLTASPPKTANMSRPRRPTRQ